MILAHESSRSPLPGRARRRRGISAGRPQRCFVSQPTLSAQIRKLEDDLGVALVERQPQQGRADARGRGVVERARRMLQEADAIVELARSARDPAGRPAARRPDPNASVPTCCRTSRRARARPAETQAAAVRVPDGPLLERLRAGELDVGVLALPVAPMDGCVDALAIRGAVPARRAGPHRLAGAQARRCRGPRGRDACCCSRTATACATRRSTSARAPARRAGLPRHQPGDAAADGRGRSRRDAAAGARDARPVRLRPRTRRAPVCAAVAEPRDRRGLAAIVVARQGDRRRLRPHRTRRLKTPRHRQAAGRAVLSCAAMRALAAALFALVTTAAHAADELPRLNILPGSLTVSGVSAGGYMATQYQVAYSKDVIGAGIIGAGPWLCAQGMITRAINDCTGGAPAGPDERPLDRDAARKRRGTHRGRSVLARAGSRLDIPRPARPQDRRRGLGFAAALLPCVRAARANPIRDRDSRRARLPDAYRGRRLRCG